MQLKPYNYVRTLYAASTERDSKELVVVEGARSRNFIWPTYEEYLTDAAATTTAG